MVFFLNNGDLLGVFSHNLSQTTLATEYPGFISDLEGYLSSGEYRDTQVLVFPDTNDINTSLEISSIKLFLNFLAQKKPRLSKLFSEYPWTYFEYGKSGKFALSTRTLLLTSDGKPGAWRPRNSYGDLQEAPLS